MDGIEAIQRKRHGVPLDEFKRVSRLGFNINPDHLEPGSVVTHRGAPGAAE